MESADGFSKKLISYLDENGNDCEHTPKSMDLGIFHSYIVVFRIFYKGIEIITIDSEITEITGE